MSAAFDQLVELFRRYMGTGPALGTIVYDEQIFPIVAVLMEEGMLKFVGVVRHRARLSPRGMIRLHGSDGRLIVTTTSGIEGDPSPEVGSLVTFPIEAINRDWPALEEKQ